MNPTFKQIAELFEVPVMGEPEEVAVEPRKRKGETAEESDELGRAYLSEGDWQKAIKHFKDAIAQREPGDVNSRIELAGALEYADQAPQALRQYQIALKAQTDAVEPHVGMSDVYKRYSRWNDCLRELEEAIRLEPSNAYYRIKLAETYREMGERSKALQSAQAAVACKPDESFYHYWVGDLLIVMKRYDEALDSLRAAIELSPGDDFLYLRSCVAFWGANRRPEAIKALRLASDLDPEKHLHYGLLAILLEETGQLDEARLESERAKKMDRYDHDSLSRLVGEMGIEL
jgi:tetratricopeptide (TPR) repeat protein